MNRNLASNTGVVIGSVQAQHQQPSSLSSGSTVSSTQSSGQSSLDNLPRKFVSSMRTLFDIMDDKRTGFVRLVDIEARWQDDGSKGLPQGVIDCLRRVTPPSGMLSFERFCAGLKICLLRNQTADCRTSRCSSTDSNGNSMLTTNKNVTKALPKEPKTIRPPSAPLLDLDNSLSSSLTSATGHWSNVNGSIGISSNTATVRPNNALPVQRTLSLPKLSPSSDGESSSERFIVPSLYAPPKPPRTALLLNSSNNSGGGATNGTNGNGAVNRENFDKAEIRHALQNWQMNVLMNEMDAKDKRRTLNGVSHMSRGSADGSSASLLLQQQQQASQQLQDVQQMTLLEFQKKSTSSSSSHRRREPRRHTLQNGIDFNVLKRLRHLEEEKDLLLEGLNAVEKAQEWYFKQIALVQEKMKYLARGDTHYEQWTDAHQERLDLQRARIGEVNRYLGSLADSWERGGFPIHMNLAVRNQYEPSFHDVQVNRLKLQNRQLTDEVSQKSERVTALEMERNAIYRELVQQQQQQQQLQQQLLRKQGHIICANEEVIF